MLASMTMLRAHGVTPPAPGRSLRIQILGPLRIWRDGVELDPGPRQQARLLALLLARAGRPVTKHELIDLMWADDPPTTALNVLHKYIGNLRRLLEPELPPRTHGSYLQRRGYGYLIKVHPDELDLTAFRGLLRTASAKQAAGCDTAALDDYVDALRLWHGSTTNSLLPGSSAVAIATALDDEFFHACGAAARLAISLGCPDRALPALQMAASLAPLNETVHAELITALAAHGQQADALAAFQAVRDRLVEELGIDPGPVLQNAHRRVLDRTIRTAHDNVRTPGASPLIVALSGTARMRESTLAGQIAGLVADDFPDGQLHVNLDAGDRPTENALNVLLRSLGVPDSRIPVPVAAKLAVYRRLTAGKRLLVVLDDALDAAQVQPLLPDSVHSLVIVISRAPLTGVESLDPSRLLLGAAAPSPARPQTGAGLLGHVRHAAFAASSLLVARSSAAPSR